VPKVRECTCSALCTFVYTWHITRKTS